jgi:hypothetical protein
MTFLPGPIEGVDEDGNEIPILVDSEGRIITSDAGSTAAAQDDLKDLMRSLLLEMRKLNTHMSLITDIEMRAEDTIQC